MEKKREQLRVTRKNIDSISSFIDGLIDTASEARSSDIHIDPKMQDAIIFFRIDGILRQYCMLEKALMGEVVGRIKVLSGLRGDIHDRSQDGRFYKQSKFGRIDIRVSIAPTYYGENVVMRLLASDHQGVSALSDLGFSKKHEAEIVGALEGSQGMVIVAGPTGAGKTSTLYSMLQYVCTGDRSVVSLEDPVEYPLPYVRQIQLKPSNGYGFHQALRGILRQDPDVIMVGEIRDKETASVAVQVALTGHLIITSIHAEDASRIIPRLIDMGIDPYLLAATVRVMVGQRLVRRIDNEQKKYEGRVGIFEVLKVDDDIRLAILQKSSAQRIEEVATRNGFMTMVHDGGKKVSIGITTTEEIKRVLQK